MDKLFLPYPSGMEMEMDDTEDNVRASNLMKRLRMFEHLPGIERFKRPHRRRPFFACTEIQRRCNLCQKLQGIYYTADIWLWRLGSAYHWKVFQFEDWCRDDIRRESVTFLRESLSKYLRLEAVICADCLMEKDFAVRLKQAHEILYGIPDPHMDVSVFLDEAGLCQFTGAVAIVDQMRAVDESVTGLEGVSPANHISVDVIRAGEHRFP